MRTCAAAGCPADISHRRSNAKYCSLQHQQTGATVVDRYCPIDGADLSHRPRWAKYCAKPKECSRIAQRQRNQERMKNPEYRAKANEYTKRWQKNHRLKLKAQRSTLPRQERYCDAQDCDAEISHKSPAAKYCSDKCSKIRRRERAREKRRQQMANQEFRDRTNSLAREQWANDEEYRKRKKQTNRRHIDKRYKEDPDFKRARIERVKSSMANNTKYTANKRANHKERLRSDPEYQDRQRDYQMAHKFGLDPGEYARMEREQEGLCAICGEGNPNGWKLAVDHSHTTDQVRALLCHNCNVGIGQFSEDTQRMLGAIEYLHGPRFVPRDIPRIPSERAFDRFKIPYWEIQSRDTKFRQRMNTHLMLRYGIDLDQYEWLLEQNKGVCWICRRPETRKSLSKTVPVASLSVDHDSETGLIRGLLCHNCNVGIGSFKHDIERLQAAIEYLEHWNSPAVDAAQAQAEESK